MSRTTSSSRTSTDGQDARKAAAALTKLPGQESGSLTTPTSGSSPAPATQAQRTLASVRQQVAEELAIRAITKAETVDGVRVGVALTLSKKDDESFLRAVASKIKHTLLLQTYLFIIMTTSQSAAAMPSPTSPVVTSTLANSLVIVASSPTLVQRAVLLASSKLLSRISPLYDEGTRWIATVRDTGTSAYDQVAMWDVVRKAARAPMDPLRPPPGSRGIDEMLADARARLQRVSPEQAFEELHDPAYPMPVFLVDIRPEAQRAEHGGIHGSLIIERNVLEWRLDPRCSARLPIADRYDLRVLVFCQEGFTSSLAAAALQDLGLLNATDVVGGYKAWMEKRVPAQIAPPAPSESSTSEKTSELVLPP